MRVVFMGSPEDVIPPANILKDSAGVDLIAVVSQPPKPAGRGSVTQDPPVAAWAKEQGILCLQPESAKSESFLNELRELKPDVIVTAAYGQILSDEFLRIPSRATINIHPSKLPQYRGATPVPQALLSGDPTTAVTILFTVKKLDAGSIILSKVFSIEPQEKSGALTKRLFNESAPLLLKALEKLKDLSFVGEVQDETKVSFCKKIAKESGEIDWNLPAKDIYNRFRAYDPWPGTWTFFNEKRVGILEMQPLDSGTSSSMGTFSFDKPTKSIIVNTGAGKIQIQSLKPSGGKAMDAASFWNGIKDKSATVFSVGINNKAIS